MAARIIENDSPWNQIVLADHGDKVKEMRLS